VSASDLNVPGFYGKIPTAGDFVSRRLAAGFVRPWDRWVARHVQPVIGTQLWPGAAALRFLSGPASFGPAAGVVVASNDRSGRRFPLCLAVILPRASIELASSGDCWFASLEEVGASAREGTLTPEELETALARIPVPPGNARSEEIHGMMVWTACSDIFDIDTDAPRAVLGEVFAARERRKSRTIRKTP